VSKKSFFGKKVRDIISLFYFPNTEKIIKHDNIMIIIILSINQSYKRNIVKKFNLFLLLSSGRLTTGSRGRRR